jgi:hypothetical protein
MIPKSGQRFSARIMRQTKSMIPKSGLFSENIMRQTKRMTRKSTPQKNITGGCAPMGVQRFSDEVMPSAEA